MVDRVPSRRAAPKKKGGARPNTGPKVGSVPEAKRVARAVAAMTGDLPHELMLRWARTGRMEYPTVGGRRAYTSDLEPSDRISCAKGCAAYYKATYQPRPAPGEQPPVVRVELDEKMVAALAKSAPDKLDVLRDVLRAIGAGGADLAQMGAVGGGGGDRPDASRYAKMLTETSDVEGRA